MIITPITTRTIIAATVARTMISIRLWFAAVGFTSPLLVPSSLTLFGTVDFVSLPDIIGVYGNFVAGSDA